MLFQHLKLDLLLQHFLSWMLLQLLFCEQLHACHSGVGKKDCLPSYYVVEGRVGEEDGEDGQEEHALSVHAGQPMLSQNGFQGLGVHCSQHSVSTQPAC